MTEVATAAVDFPALELTFLIHGQGLMNHLLLLCYLTLLLVVNGLEQLEADRFIDSSRVFIIVQSHARDVKHIFFFGVEKDFTG